MINSQNSPRRNEYHIPSVMFFKHSHLLGWNGGGTVSGTRQRDVASPQSNSTSLYPRVVHCMTVLTEREYQAKLSIQSLPTFFQELSIPEDTKLIANKINCMQGSLMLPTARPHCASLVISTAAFFPPLWLHLSDIWLQATHRITQWVTGQ